MNSSIIQYVCTYIYAYSISTSIPVYISGYTYTNVFLRTCFSWRGKNRSDWGVKDRSEAEDRSDWGVKDRSEAEEQNIVIDCDLWFRYCTMFMYFTVLCVCVCLCLCKSSDMCTITVSQFHFFEISWKFENKQVKFRRFPFENSKIRKWNSENFVFGMLIFRFFILRSSIFGLRSSLRKCAITS